LEIRSSSLNIIHEFGENEDAKSNSVAALVNSKEKIKIRRIGEPLLSGLGLEQVHQILLMNSRKMRMQGQVQ